MEFDLRLELINFLKAVTRVVNGDISIQISKQNQFPTTITFNRTK